MPRVEVVTDCDYVAEFGNVVSTQVPEHRAERVRVAHKMRRKKCRRREIRGVPAKC